MSLCRYDLFTMLSLILPRIVSIIVTVILLSLCSNSAIAQRLELVRYVGSGGIGFDRIRGLSVGPDGNALFLDGPNNLVKYSLQSRKFTKKCLIGLDLSQSFRAATGSIGKYFVVVHGRDTGTSVNVMDEKLNLVRQVQLQEDVVGDVGVLTKRMFRVCTSSGKLIDIDVVNGSTANYQISNVGTVTSYRRFNGEDYIVDSDTKLLNVTNLNAPKLVLEDADRIYSFCIFDTSLVQYVTDRYQYVLVKNNTVVKIPYPGPNYSRPMQPISIVRAGSKLVLADDHGLIIANQDFEFLDRYGFTDNTEEPSIQDAADKHGRVAVGRVGFVYITDSDNKTSSVKLLSSTKLPAIPKALCFDNHGSVYVSYVETDNYLRFESGIIKIDIATNSIIGRWISKSRIESSFDICHNGDLYFVGNDVLYKMKDSLLRDPVEIVTEYPVRLLAKQGKFVYALTYQPQRVIKVDRNGTIVDPDFLRSAFEVVDEYGQIGYFTILPGEFIIGDYFGFLDIPGIPKIDPIMGFIGNGDGDYFIGSTWNNWFAPGLYRYVKN